MENNITISDEYKENIKKTIEEFGVDVILERTNSMISIESSGIDISKFSNLSISSEVKSKSIASLFLNPKIDDLAFSTYRDSSVLPLHINNTKIKHLLSEIQFNEMKIKKVFDFIEVKKYISETYSKEITEDTEIVKSLNEKLVLLSEKKKN